MATEARPRDRRSVDTKRSEHTPSAADSASAAEGSAPVLAAAPAPPPPAPRTASSFLTQNIDMGQTLWQLLSYCFLTGFTCGPTFLACYVWAGFQTGNLVQCGLAVARLFGSNDLTFHKADQQALTSLLSFLVGTSVGRIGDKVGPKRRWWIMVATFIMALETMAAALCAHYSGEESIAQYRTEGSWRSATGMAALGFASAALGLQGIVSKRLTSQLGTTVVLTTVWVELVNDPALFARRLVKTRDHRVLGVFFTFLGGMCSAGLVWGSSSAVAFGVGAGLRIISMLSWLLVPGEKLK
ncbi:YoaK family protein [Rhodotorula paludigena]|uniref:YoaK family protein n=1 Tax=Rhodotorula paludigena TaxID=86838 RepID=UPI0031715A6F